MNSNSQWHKKPWQPSLDWTTASGQLLRQAVRATFCERIYTTYKLDPRKYLSIQIWPEHMFGRVTQDNRDRVVEVKKISKSDQPI